MARNEIAPAETATPHPIERSSLSLWAAALAIAAALVAAVAPAAVNRSVVTWPGDGTAPPTDGLAGASLLVARQEPEALAVSIPCSVSDESPGSQFRTAFEPESTNGLNITTDDASLAVFVGNELLVSIPLESVREEAASRTCAIGLQLGDRQWRVTLGDATTEVDSDAIPTVSGFFGRSSLIDSDRGTIRVTLTTHTSGSSPSALQWVTIVISLMAVVAAAWLSPRRLSIARIRAGIASAFGWLDALVVTVLLGWGIVAPPLLDDGWVMQTVTHRYPGGQFRSYNDTWDATLPLGFLHDSVYWFAAHTSDVLMVWRFVSIAVLIAGWLLLRVALTSVVPRADRISWAAVASYFLLATGAWLVTLRPEPMVGAASAMVLCAAIGYQRRPDTSLLFLGGVVAAISTSLHPSGVVAAAPLLALTPTVVAGLRSRRVRVRDVLSPALASGAVLILAIFADSDVSQWSLNRDLFASAGSHALGWRDELDRYRLLLTSVYDTVLRRMSVLVPLFVLGIGALRVASRGARRSNLPIASLALGMAFLVVTPSKWPWHFGSIAVLSAAALGVELHYFLTSRAGSKTWAAAIWTGSTVLASSIAWRGEEVWGLLVSADGRQGFLSAAERLSSPLVPVLAFGITALVLLIRHRSPRRAALLASAVLPTVVMSTMVVATMARFVVPVGRDDWSPVKENLEALGGTNGCALTDRLGIDDPTTATAAPRAGNGGTATGFDTDVAPLDDDQGAPPYVITSDWATDSASTYGAGDAEIGWVSTPWQRLPSADELGLFAELAGTIDGVNQVALQRGVPSPSGVEVTTTDWLTLDVSTDAWQRVQLAHLNDVQDGTLARLVLVDRLGGNRGWIAATDIFTAETRPLRSVVSADRVVRVDPFFRPYMRCISEPPLVDGIAQVPDLVIGAIPLSPTSSQRFALDVRDSVPVWITSEGTKVLDATFLLPRDEWHYVPWSMRG